MILPAKTVRFTAAGAVGLLPARKAIVVIASGDSYGVGSPAQQLDHETPYLEFLLGSLGVQEITFVHASGTKQVGQDGKAIDRFLEPLKEEVTRLISEPKQTLPFVLDNKKDKGTPLATASR